MYLKRNEKTEAADEIITVHGDSMEPKLHDGDDLPVKHAAAVEYSEIGIFVVYGEGLVKEYRPEGLYSLNREKYPLIPASGIVGCLCMGKVLGVVTPDMLAQGRRCRRNQESVCFRSEEGKTTALMRSNHMTAKMSFIRPDKRSFLLGMITAFCECVADGCKRLALRPPLVKKLYGFQEWHDLRVMPSPVPSVHSVG